jgi:hypothetical protein
VARIAAHTTNNCAGAKIDRRKRRVIEATNAAFLLLSE